MVKYGDNSSYVNCMKRQFLSQMTLLSSSVIVGLIFSTFILNCEAAKVEREKWPIFLEPVANVTVAVGRGASLACSVDHLGQHKVAWVHLDREMIVAIHRQIVSREQRFFVTHDSHKTWTLHVTEVTEKDRGFYMCQVNTDPMISQKGYMQVVVPPNIVDNNSSASTLMTREKESVSLNCEAEGFPQPKIRWRREDGQAVVIKEGKRVHHVEGNILSLKSVNRDHMGAYLCIASNGVPPSVSKRITLEVQFAPELHVPNQLVGVPLHNEIQLECQIEASPKPVTYWTLDGVMISNSTRVIAETISDSFRYSMFLIIRDVQEQDFGRYLCTAKNSFSEIKGSIKLNKVDSPTRPSPTYEEGHYLDNGNIDQSTAARHHLDTNNHIDSRHPNGIQIKGDIDDVSHIDVSRNSYNDKRNPEMNGRKTLTDSERDRINRNLSIRPISPFEYSAGGSMLLQNSTAFLIQILLIIITDFWINLVDSLR